MVTKPALNRQAVFEVFESRCLMAADLQASSAPVTETPAVTTIEATTTAVTSATPVYLRTNANNQTSDLNLDGVINHRDAHAVISFLNARLTQNPAEGESGSGSDSNDSLETKYDSNSDGQVSPLDVLWIVNQIKEYDPLTPCDCGACSRPTMEGRCENASIAQTQSASLLSEITLAPEAEMFASQIQSLGQSQIASTSYDDLLRIKRA